MKVAVAFVLFLSLGGVVPAAPAAGARPDEAAVMLSNLNGARAAAGLPALTIDPRLDRLAHEHAVDMIARHYLAHETPEGASPFDRMDRAGYRYGCAGENLAVDTDADSAFRDLLASSSHRANILNPHFRRVGIAAIPDRAGEVFVQDFSD